jgi:hypothetical protein
MVSVHLFGKERPKELSDTINSLSRHHRPVRPYRKQVPHRPGIAPALGLRAGARRSCKAGLSWARLNALLARFVLPAPPGWVSPCVVNP